MATPIQKIQETGQSVWYDNISRGMIESGELQKLIDSGITGLTSNPTIFQKAITGSSDYDAALDDLAKAGKSDSEIFEALGIADIQAAADLLRSIFDQTRGDDGYASFEVNPHLAHDTDGTIEEARRLFAAIDRPNVMIKVPATPEGIPAVKQLIGEGINVNVTLIFSLESYKQVIEAYISGLELLDKNDGKLSSVASVASFFVSRVDTSVDTLLKERIAEGYDILKPLIGKAAIANAKMAYQTFKLEFGRGRFNDLRDRGARVQRPLWASTSVKNPDLDDLLYVWNLIGVNTVNTMPQVTIDTLMERGIDARQTIDGAVDTAKQVERWLKKVGINMDVVTDKLLADGVEAFADSYDALLADIRAKCEKLTAAAGGA
jgi:transaldolase